MSILAHRRGRGDIIWACWQPGLAGKKVKDVRYVNSGAMFVMMTPTGAAAIAAQMAKDAGKSNAAMSPYHFDLCLKAMLAPADSNRRARACYVFPPLGNYTQHISGCDPKFARGEGRPNCWREGWACPGTTVEEDPQRREKRFLAWKGAAGHEDVGSATVDESVAGHIEWLSWWQGEGDPVKFRPDEERRPQKVRKRPAAEGSARVEPPATLRGSKGKGKGQTMGVTTTTEGILQTFGCAGKGKGKPPPFSFWPNPPGSAQPPLDTDPMDTRLDDDDPAVAKATKRQRRNLRAVLVNRSFRTWVRTRVEASHYAQKKYMGARACTTPQHACMFCVCCCACIAVESSATAVTPNSGNRMLLWIVVCIHC